MPISEKLQECLDRLDDLQICAEFLRDQSVKEPTIDKRVATRQLAQELARCALDLEQLTI